MLTYNMTEKTKNKIEEKGADILASYCDYTILNDYCYSRDNEISRNNIVPNVNMGKLDKAIIAHKEKQKVNIISKLIAESLDDNNTLICYFQNQNNAYITYNNNLIARVIDGVISIEDMECENGYNKEYEPFNMNNVEDLFMLLFLCKKFGMVTVHFD